MDQAAALVILRHVLTALGAYLVTKGVINDGQLQIIIGAIIAVAPTIWGIIQKQQQKTAVVKAAVTGVPVQATVTSPVAPTPQETAIANASPTVQTSLKDKP